MINLKVVLNAHYFFIIYSDLTQQESTNPLKQTGQSCNKHLKMPEIPKSWNQGRNDWAEENGVFLLLAAPLLLPKAVAWPARHGMCRTPVPAGGCSWDSWLHKADPSIYLAGHRGRKRTSPGFKNIMNLQKQPGSRGICAVDDSVG